MPAVELHTLTPEDWGLWRQLRRRALAEDPCAFSSTLAEWSGDGDREERWRARLTSVAFNLVASLDRRPVGMVSATAPQGDETELISMWVGSEARRSGVATALIEAVAEWSRDQGATRVALDVMAGNRGAVDLYAACGFIDVGPAPNSGLERPERRMVRTLG